ncbi:branched-chain amino acid ABC transporter permease [Treponema primitia]|uniref:branched-chain amino acid ABC transporter permease n=1 Tax=Treponema primitia TaxID=88058 RepID=UPI0002555468|nr:branched-chain amino acid ABC transporter permease [Treponema primitia]
MILDKKQNRTVSIIALILVVGFIILADRVFNSFSRRIFNLCGIYIILALSLNLLNGFTGLFSLGHSGFMAIGAYVSALLTMSPAQKSMNYFMTPIVPILANVELPFIPALIIAGLTAALAGFLIGTPVLRLRDDYLAIATLGFSEIIRVVLTNLQSVTNGALGLKGLPKYANTYMIWALAFLTVIFMIALINSAFGRACKAVRDNEIAAQAMGIHVARVKILSFTISSFIAGIGGALLGHLMNTIDPKMFTFSLTYNILLIVVLGGNGSITGSVIAALIVTISMEALRFLDGPLNLLFFRTQGLPGLRMVVFSALLLLVVIYRQEGLMGKKEFSWNRILDTGPIKKLLGRGGA